VEKSPTPSLLPILRSQQQAEILAWLLDDPDREVSLVELAKRLGVPVSSVHREIERAEAAGIVVSRRVGQTRLVRANRQSRFFAPLRELLVMAFGAPARLSRALGSIPGVEGAYIFGSWAARYSGIGGSRPVGDLDLLVLGSAEREAVYRAVTEVEAELGYPVQVTFRGADWLEAGRDAFHDTVVSRSLVQILGTDDRATNGSAASMASVAH
jgi:DNA-binding transcriptional ArsR family regulator